MSVVTRKFRTHEEFMRYCLYECRDYKLDCAHTCAYRIKLKVPPHGEKYPQGEAEQ